MQQLIAIMNGGIIFMTLPFAADFNSLERSATTNILKNMLKRVHHTFHFYLHIGMTT